MRKQAALFVSALALMTAVSFQPANAFSLFHKKATKPAVVAPVKAPEAPAVKTPVVPAKPVVKAPAKAAVKAPAKPVAKTAVKTAVAKKAPVKK